jgi:ketosteroid isomerase-like protein
MAHLALRALVSILGTAVMLVACKPAAQDTAADGQAVAATAAGWEKAYNEKNAEGVAALYSEDGQLLPPGPPVVNGSAAIRDYWAKDIAGSGAPIKISSDASGVGGDWAWRAGSWSSTDAQGAAVNGKYVEVWHRTAAGWKLHRDIWNVDDAAAAATPAQP